MMRKVAEHAAGKSPAEAETGNLAPPVDLAPPIRKEAPASVAATPAPAAAPAAAPALPLGAIQVLNGSNAGKTLDLVKPLTTLGKPGVQVAVIARRPHGYFLTHVEGARQPTVNGAAINPQAHELKDHDVVELAGVKMEFFLRS
jgi:hypothetical protein